MARGAQRNEGRRERMRRDWGSVSVIKLAEREGTSVGAIYRLARELGLSTQTRRYSATLRDEHRAIEGRTTKYPHSVISAKASKRVLVSGHENRKLGSKVTKGIWKGMPIYAVTLVERASCPASCREWTTCYGNSMNFARRHVFDAELFKRLDVEIDMLAAKHPGGFLVRLHTLGDFGRDDAEALPYVELWRHKMIETPGLHLFGFTAHTLGSLTGQAIRLLNGEFPARCRIRFSGHDALVIAAKEDSKHVVCPIETDHPKRPASCGACGLCWAMPGTVEFVRH